MAKHHLKVYIDNVLCDPKLNVSCPRSIIISYGSHVFNLTNHNLTGRADLEVKQGTPMIHSWYTLIFFSYTAFIHYLFYSKWFKDIREPNRKARCCFRVYIVIYYHFTFLFCRHWSIKYVWNYLIYRMALGSWIQAWT